MQVPTYIPLLFPQLLLRPRREEARKLLLYFCLYLPFSLWTSSSGARWWNGIYMRSELSQKQCTGLVYTVLILSHSIDIGRCGSDSSYNVRCSRWMGRSYVNSRPLTPSTDPKSRVGVLESQQCMSRYVVIAYVLEASVFAIHNTCANILVNGSWMCKLRSTLQQTRPDYAACSAI